MLKVKKIQNCDMHYSIKPVLYIYIYIKTWYDEIIYKIKKKKLYFKVFVGIILYVFVIKLLFSEVLDYGFLIHL